MSFAQVADAVPAMIMVCAPNSDGATTPDHVEEEESCATVLSSAKLVLGYGAEI